MAGDAFSLTTFGGFDDSSSIPAPLHHLLNSKERTEYFYKAKTVIWWVVSQHSDLKDFNTTEVNPILKEIRWHYLYIRKS